MFFGSELAHLASSRRARFYYRFLGHDHMGHRVRAAHFGKALRGLPSPRRILDAGSGEGCYSLLLARRYPQAQVVGVELLAELVDRANLLTGKLGMANATFVQADLEGYCAEWGFDLIVCIDTLEHIRADGKVLGNLREMLAPGRQMLLHVPRRRQLCQFWFPSRVSPAMAKDHVRDEYTEEEIRGKLKGAGWQIVELRYTFGPLGSLARELFYLSEGVRHPGLRALLKLGLFPLEVALAYFDTCFPNRREHQGFLIKAIGDGQGH